MKNSTKEATTQFMCILDCLGVPKDQNISLTALLKTVENMSKVVDRLEEKDFKVTPQQALNICGAVIKENLDKE